MLTEIIQTGPDFFPFRTIGGCTAETFVRGILWCNFMYTFSMPFEIIIGTEAIRFGTAWFLTLVGPGVSQYMFPIMQNQWKDCRIENHYLPMLRRILKGTIAIRFGAG